jgi:hypothetical protein
LTPEPTSLTDGVSTAPFRSFAPATGAAIETVGAVASSVTVNGAFALVELALFVAVTFCGPDVVVAVVQL